MRSDHDLDLTTRHVRLAVDGVADSVQWIADRFMPITIAQARHHAARGLDGVHDVDDLVQEVWLRIFGKLPEFQPAGERFTPSFVRWISKIFLNHYNTLLERHITRGAGRRVALPDDTVGVPDETRSIVTRVIESERADLVADALDRLVAEDREALVLRMIEGVAYDDLARAWSIAPAAARKRVSRALARMRRLLPDSVLAAIGDE